MVDDLYIAIESLRNGFKHLQSHLLSFLMASLEFADCPTPRDELWAYWTALDVNPPLAHSLADKGIMCRDGRLCVNVAHSDDPGLLEFSYNACMEVF